MPITADTLRWRQSERMTDNTDGGGRMTGVEIVPGVENQVFDDLSDVDRAAGDVSIRKVYAAVESLDADKYLDAGVVVFAAPADPDVSVVAFSTGDYYDERAALRERLESGISRGGLYMGWLWGDHIQGQRAIVLWQRLSAGLPSTGQRLELVARNAGVTQHNQVLWITRVMDEIVERVDGSGPYQVRSVMCEIAEALRDDYTGVEPTRIDPPGQTTTGTAVYETRYNQEAVPIVGVQPLAEASAVGDYSVKVTSLYCPMIPTVFAETPIADTTPGADSPALVRASNSTATVATALAVVKPGASFYLGSPVFPGTLSLSVSGGTITDDGGTLRLAGTAIGSINYGAGVCTWSDACPNYGTSSKSAAFTPAAAPLRVADTAVQVCTVENRGFVWVITLAPIPTPGSLRVAYRVNNAWYVLTDTGAGSLRGADSSYGSGTLNFSTGTVTLTTGALPDPESEILYVWATPIAYTARGGTALDPLNIRLTINPGVLPGSVEVEWAQGQTTYTLSDAGDGTLAGTGGTGTISYATGALSIVPGAVPAMGTEFDIVYDAGPPITTPLPNELPDPDHWVTIQLDAPLRPGSVELTWNVRYTPPEGLPAVELAMTVQAKDDGAGALVIPNGVPGTIDYDSGIVHFDPRVWVITMVRTEIIT